MIAHSFSFRQDQKDAIYLATLQLSLPNVKGTLGEAHVRWGKTLVGLKVAEDWARRQGVVVVTPRREVMHQWRKGAITYAEHAALYYEEQRERVAFDFESVGLIGDGYKEFAHVNICTLRSAYLHMRELLQWMKANGIRPKLMIFDEAQYGLSETSKQMIDMWLKAKGKILFLTATPSRSDGQSLNKYISSVAFRYTPKHGVRTGVLVESRAIKGQGKEPDEIVEDWLTYAEGRSTIAFTKTIDQAAELAYEFTNQGVRAAAITGDTPTQERDRIMRLYRDGEITVLVNVKVLTDGVDANITSCVILANGVATDTPHIQRVGRALGAHSDDEVLKQDAIIIVSDVPREIKDFPTEGRIEFTEERLRTAANAWWPTRWSLGFIDTLERMSEAITPPAHKKKRK